MEGLLILTIAIIVGFALYFLPTWLAHRFQHPKRTAITVLNVFGGWIIVGWIVALVWACTSADANNNNVRKDR